MKKEKLAIISSYSDFCGNASYTKALSDGLSEHYDLTVLSLDVHLLRKGGSKKGKLYIRSLCSQLQSFDCVNIQFEAGLFGSTISNIQKNFFRIANASKRLVITMHRVHGEAAYPSFSHLAKSFLLARRLMGCIRDIASTYANNRYVSLYNKIIRFCIKTNTPIIVHTQRDKNYIQRLDHKLVFDHPLSFYNQSYIHSLSNSFSREDFCREFGLDSSQIYMGVFGFINHYKGHETAIKALEYLPSKYKLIVFGAQHPHTIGLGEKINPYLKDLITLVENLELSNRVIFYRTHNDDEFLKALLRCDYNLLPYLEVNQGGSGIAALSLETNSNAIFSQTHAFFELERYAQRAFKMFSIGNYHELAHSVLSYQKDHFDSNLKEYHNKYNLTSNVNLYKSLLSRDFSFHRDPCEKAESLLRDCIDCGLKKKTLA